LEVLLLRRNAALLFAGGQWVFPGGAIDRGDFLEGSDLMTAAKQAAVREAREETGLRIDIDALQFFAHWTTPEGEGKRYATWFFAAAVAGAAADVEVDGGEIVDHRWLEPQRAIALHRAGEMDMLPPTFITLAELARCKTIQQVERMYVGRPVLEILPKFVATKSGDVALYPLDSGYAAGDAAVPGVRHRCYRAADGWHYECDISHRDE